MRSDANGDAFGTDGDPRSRRWVSTRRDLAFWGLWLGLLTAVALANAASDVTEAARLGEAIETWEPYVWEVTSALGILAALPALVWFVRRHPLSRQRLARQVAVHAMAVLAFSAVHIATMVMLREAVYVLVSKQYSFGPWVPELIYELRKDLAAYLLIIVILNLMRSAGWMAPDRPRSGTGGDIQEAVSDSPESPRTVQPRQSLILPDGTRRLRVDPQGLLAAKAAGNYVELLREGAAPLLVRATLTEVEAAARPFGFLRVHRSWIVAGDRVQQIASTRAGDFRALLDGGLAVPGSRRYRGNLTGLLGKQTPADQTVSPSAPD
ncbi:MAG: LytTR family DNA-binding domain-containing protein [Kiloniellales bacterium]